mmetsp:Transcript_21605/g.30274  ORF Transcript_21605/g.30274 Transcript_21605/m.30274 type:complete len:507 (-) Transcript_21605:1976-3496(-)
MGDLNIHWVEAPNKLGGKPKRRSFEYGGYVVTAPCTFFNEQGVYLPVEDLTKLHQTLKNIEKERKESDISAELPGLQSLFVDGTAKIQQGSRGTPEVLGKCMPSSLIDRDNLCDLEVLEKADISYQIRMRYYKNKIYTNIGHILVAVNPYTELDFVEGPCKDSPLDTLDAIGMYHKGAYTNFEGLPPHIYAVAARAFVQCTDENKNQSVIISGESGSGKTVTTKLVLKFFQGISSKNAAKELFTNEDDSKEGAMSIEEKIASTNPILESFGNAKTLRNNNSSRFGKWMELLMHGGKILGANIEEYLLEKSRIVAPGKGERNYHIFYMVCEYLHRLDQGEMEGDDDGGGGGDEYSDVRESLLEMGGDREKLGYSLGDYKKGIVEYLKPSKGNDDKPSPVYYHADGWDDAGMFQEVLHGLKSTGLWRFHKDILAVVCCVLHLGNIVFEGDTDSSIVSEKSLPIVRHCAKLLNTDHKALADALTTNYATIKGELIKVVEVVVGVCSLLM